MVFSSYHDNRSSCILSWVLSEALLRRFSRKSVFLKILQNLQGNTCIRVSFLNTLLIGDFSFIKRVSMNFVKCLKSLVHYNIFEQLLMVLSHQRQIFIFKHLFSMQSKVSLASPCNEFLFLNLAKSQTILFSRNGVAII